MGYPQQNQKSNDSDNAATATPRLRIFLSYGHDENKMLVDCIRADLKARGHDVWIDEIEIKVKNEWRRKIIEGIEESQAVLGFLSKHSMREDKDGVGVCRDELKIALGVKGGCVQTVLVEDEREINNAIGKIPPNIGRIQRTDMHDWKNQCVVDGRVVRNEWYQARLAEIIQVVESDESRRFAEEIEELRLHLDPMWSDAYVKELLEKSFFRARMAL